MSCSSPAAEWMRKFAWAGLLAQRNHQRELIERDRLAIAADRSEPRPPLLGLHPARLFERDSEQRAGGLVVEQQQSAVVDEERGDGDAREEVAGQDQLEGFCGRWVLESLITAILASNCR